MMAKRTLICMESDESDEAPRLAAAFDWSDALWCQLPRGHEGPHRWTHEWTTDE